MSRHYNIHGGLASMEDVVAGRALTYDEVLSLWDRNRERSEACIRCCVGCGQCIYRESMQTFDDLRHATPGQYFFFSFLKVGSPMESSFLTI